MAELSYLRASDADRDAIAERLRGAAIEGRLDAEELEERLHLALRARTYGDLERLVEDLPRQSVRRAARAPASLGGAAVVALRVVFALVAIAVILTGAVVMAAWWVLWVVVWVVLRGHGCARGRRHPWPPRYRLAGQR